MDSAALRNRLIMATSMWRETTEDPLPKMPPGDPEEQLKGFELQLVELMFAGATPVTARTVADKTWELVHDRPDADPVKARVVRGHDDLARLAAEDDAGPA